MTTLYQYCVDNYGQQSTDAAVKLFRRITRPPKRGFEKGQLCYSYVERHGSTTTVPKNGCLLILKNQDLYYDDAWQVACVGVHNNSEYTWRTQVPCTYTAHKRVLERLDFEEVLRVELGGAQPRHLSCALNTFVRYVRSESLRDQLARAFGLMGTRRLTDRLASWVNADERNTSKHWNFTSSANQHCNNPEFHKTIRETFAKMGERYGVWLRGSAELEKIRQTAEGSDEYRNKVLAYLRDLNTAYGTVSNRWRVVSDKERNLLVTLREAVKLQHGVHALDCNHYEFGSRVHSVSGNTYCEACYASKVVSYGEPVLALDRYGNERYMWPHDVYTWEDGSKRDYAEPPVIGQYHSSKNLFVQSLPHVTGKMPHKSVVKLGFELEFVRATSTDDNVVARQMKRTLRDFMEQVSPGYNVQPYAGFERDGSVDFEMVSGYGPIDIHRAAVIALLGGNPYAGKLNSHNGGRCGLHVHLDKPSSLIHATKLQQFYNQRCNERLVRAVARRYGTSGYAKVDGSKGDLVQAAKQYREYNRYSGYAKKDAVARAITRLTTDRYEMVNFQPNKTVEIRAFRGSMIVGTVLACLEFALLSYYFTRDNDKYSLGEREFLEFISKPEWRHESQYLRKYLFARGFKVFMPKKVARHDCACVEA